AAAAWSCVEKMLQLAQRTSAPSSTSVSMSTAVCTVMCSEPAILAPLSGFAAAYSLRVAMRPGISCSARRISLRPNSARDRSATLKSIGSQSLRCPSRASLGFPAGGTHAAMDESDRDLLISPADGRIFRRSGLFGGGIDADHGGGQAARGLAPHAPLPG